MANVIKHKRGSGSDPSASDLVVGEVAIRTDVGKLFTKMDNGSVAEIAGGGSDIAINTLSSSSGTGGGSATFNGSAYRFTLSAPPSVSAQQLLVSINGVIQKPVAGTGQPSEGFSVDGTDIILGDAPATGSDFFILTFKSLGVSEPADNSVTSAKIVDGTIVNADINASAAIAGSKISPDFGSQNITTTGSLAGNGLTVSASNPQIVVQDSDGTNQTTQLIQSSGAFFIDIRNDSNNGTFLVRGKGGGTASEYLRIDGSGNVGIGTTSPTEILHLKKTVAASSDTDPTFLKLENASDGGSAIESVNSVSGTTKLSFGVEGTGSSTNETFMGFSTSFNGTLSEAMRINSSGNVGIGTTSPACGLHIDNPSNAAITQILDTDNSAVKLVFRNNTETGNNMQIGADGSNLVALTGATERMRIDSSGNVGVGTTSPSYRLSVEAASGTDVTALFKSDDANAWIQIRDNTTTDTGVMVGANGDNLLLRAGSNTRMYLKSDGNVGIGTTSPSTKLHITGDITLEDPSPSISFVDNDQDSDFKLVVNSHQFRIYDITNASTRFVLDSSGNVGIGTVSPAFNLDVVGAIHSSAAITGQDFRSDSGTTFFLTSGSDWRFRATGGTEHMRIDSSGRVLIGTTTEGNSSADDLTIASSTSCGISIRSGTSNSGNVYFSDGTSGADEYRGFLSYSHTNNNLSIGINAATRLQLSSSELTLFGSYSNNAVPQTNLIFGIKNSNGDLKKAQITSNKVADVSSTMEFGTTASHTYAERMRIHSNGFVGIGTNSPSTVLHIADSNAELTLERTGTHSTSASPLIQFKGRGPNATMYNFAKIDAVSSGSNNAGHLRFYTNTGGNQNERMRIASNGNALFHTTTNDNTIDGNGGIQLSDDGNGSFIRISKKTTQAVPAMEFYNANGRVGQIIPSGSSTSFTTSSDYRLKENATAISDGITRVKTLKPYRFNFKAAPKVTVDGFFAHEVTAVPEAISGTKDEVDENNDPVYQGIDQSKLVPLLVAALQEAIGRIEALEAK